LKARIRVVVVDHDGGPLTVRCLASVFEHRPPGVDLDVVLVDNASRHPVTAEVESRWPQVRVVRSDVNLGFAGGADLGIGDVAEVDHVALLNNDAYVTEGWLEPLVEALGVDARAGAACPKILFAPRFAELRLEMSPPSHRRGDRRQLGVRLGGVEVELGAGAVRLVDGFWGPEPHGRGWAQWTAPTATLFVPVDDGGRARVRLQLDAPRPVTVTCRAGSRVTELAVDRPATWHAVEVDGETFDVVNNVGNVLLADGYGADRGYEQRDAGQFDVPEEVFAWCGGAVLLRGSYLADVGGFDRRLFLYYEDLELAWRGRRRGWRYCFVPTSVVRHDHAATAITGSALAEHHKERNRLLVLARHGRPGALLRAAGRYLLATASYAWRDGVVTVLNGEPVRPTIAWRRLRAFAGFLRLLPAMIAARRQTATPMVSTPLPSQSPRVGR
jgi:hypothetical protein